MTPPVVMSVAGSDSSGGAGIQADLKTFAALGCYGASVVTAVTAQNTVGVRDVFAVPASIVGQQLAAVLDDMPVAAVKVGMVASADIAAQIAARARAGDLPNLVVDPVLSASTGRRLGITGAVERLLPYATVLTPNLREASAILGWKVSTPADMAGAAAQLAAHGARCVVVTGGDRAGGDSGGDIGDDTCGDTGDDADEDAVDAVWTAQGARLLRAPRVRTHNTHGTGCTFSSAIAARLAHGYPAEDCVDFAKRFVRAALIAARQWRLGAGAGPLNHFFEKSTA